MRATEASLDGYDAERADFERLLAALEVVEAAPLERLRELPWIYDWVCSIGLAHLHPVEEAYVDLVPLVNASHQGIAQHPLEFARWLHLLSGLEVRSYLEIGCYNGGTCSLAAAYLRRFQPEFRLVTIDLYPWFFFEEEITRKLPVEYRFGVTSHAVRGERYDAVFIDGDHTFEWSRFDYQNAGRQARICGFHDICSEHYLTTYDLGGVPALWELIKRDSGGPGVEFLEFSEHPAGDQFGIGVRLQR